MTSQATHLKAGPKGEPMLVDSKGKRQEFKSASVLKAGPGGVPVCETNVVNKGNVLFADEHGRPHCVDRKNSEPAKKVTKKSPRKPAKKKATN